MAFLTNKLKLDHNCPTAPQSSYALFLCSQSNFLFEACNFVHSPEQKKKKRQRRGVSKLAGVKDAPRNKIYHCWNHVSVFVAAISLACCCRRRFRQRVSAEDVGVEVLGPANLIVVFTAFELAFAERYFLRVFFPAYSNQISIIVWFTVPTTTLSLPSATRIQKSIRICVSRSDCMQFS